MSHMSCRKCDDFANKNMEAFVISREHTCAKLDPEASLIEEEETPKAQAVYRSAASAHENDYRIQSSVKKQRSNT